MYGSSILQIYSRTGSTPGASNAFQPQRFSLMAITSSRVTRSSSREGFVGVPEERKSNRLFERRTTKRDSDNGGRRRIRKRRRYHGPDVNNMRPTSHCRP